MLSAEKAGAWSEALALYEQALSQHEEATACAGLGAGVSIWEDKKMSEHARWQGRYAVPDAAIGGP